MTFRMFNQTPWEKYRTATQFLETSRFVEPLMAIMDASASPEDEQFQGQIDTAARAACCASYVLVNEAMHEAGGCDEMVLGMHKQTVAATIFVPIHNGAKVTWDYIEDDRLWSAILTRLQRFLMQCESLKVEAMTLDAHLRAKRMSLTADDAAQFFSSKGQAVTSSLPIDSDTATKTCAEHFPICAKFFGKGELGNIALMLPVFVASIAEFIEVYLWATVKDLWRQRSTPDQLSSLDSRPERLCLRRAQARSRRHRGVLRGPPRPD